MKTVKNFDAWRAEQIAKVYLLNSGLVSLLPDAKNKFDFIAVSKKSPDKIFAVEVKQYKPPKAGLSKSKNGNPFTVGDKRLPVLTLYIDNDAENGVYQLSDPPEVRSNATGPIESKDFTSTIRLLTT